MSGDLYRARLAPSALTPAAGIPIFPRGAYEAYLRVIGLSAPGARRIRLALERWSLDRRTTSWSRGATDTVVLTPAGTGVSAATWTGVLRRGGRELARLRLVWVSPMLRRATVEIDRVAGAEVPLDSGAGETWRSIFGRAGWRVDVVESQRNVPEPSGASWSDAELHAALLAFRDRADLDREWRYHSLCVRRLDSTSRGIMYDAGGSDSNRVPREGAAIASHWRIPRTAVWGAAAGRRFGAVRPAYFRTAVHEISHAMGLYHPRTAAVSHLMQGTNAIAANATPTRPFPANIEWRHSAADRLRLCHLPDPWVRPGDLPFGFPYAGAPMSRRIRAVRLSVAPVLRRVPIGAPVRIELALSNLGRTSVGVPSRFGLKAGTVTGEVIGPDSTRRSFRSLVLCIDETDQLAGLAAGGRIRCSETLLRGAEGALFAAPGAHQIRVGVDCVVDGSPVRVGGETRVEVTPPVDSQHAQAAREILACPDALLSLAFGGDHLVDGLRAIHAGLANTELSPHFAWIEAKRCCRRFGNRAPDLAVARRLVDARTVLSEGERSSARALLSTRRRIDEDHRRIKHDARRHRALEHCYGLSYR